MGALVTLRKNDNWIFDEDAMSQRPNRTDHYVLHKAKIDLPQAFKLWLEENQDPDTLQPRKQDRKKPKEDGKFAVVEKFHISLYSFQAARADAALGGASVGGNSYQSEPRVAHHEIPTEEALRADLASADWMLVLVSPGWTGTPALIPQVLAAVRLSDLASGAMTQ